MPLHSAGVLIYRRDGDDVAVLLVHPGGPYWLRRDAGAWQIPKGLIEPGEDASQAARREAEEELGIALVGDPVPLASVRQAGGKIVDAFALEQQVDVSQVRSNLFEMEWPRGSGRIERFPEVSEARWFALDDASAMMLTSQIPLLDALRAMLDKQPA